MFGLNIALLIIFILLTAFFVSAEFAFVKVRHSKIEQLVLEGNKRALKAQRVITHLDEYLSACQLGITITALGIGWLGEPTFEKVFGSLLAGMNLPEGATHAISLGMAFALITFLHVVVGELAPKSIAIQKSEAICLLLAGPMIQFYRLLFPFIWVLNGSAALLIRLFGFKPAKEHEDVHTEEELRLLLSESYQNGEINQAEYKYVNRIFNFDELLAREIMVPRIDMVVLNSESSFEDNMNIIKKEQYTRFPVAKEDKDEIIGMIHAKDFFLKINENPNIDFSEVIRPVLVYPDITPVKTLLKEMQNHRIPFAILTDEYGGTSGLVTMEDILEEIVGEIRDEFDGEEKSEIEIVNESEWVVDGMVLLSEIADLAGLSFEEEEYDTIGGWLYVQNSKLSKGKKYVSEHVCFEVLEREKKRYKRIRIQLINEQ